MKVTRVLHVSVNVVGGLDANAGFYGEILELPSTLRPEIPFIDGQWFEAGDVQVHLVDAQCAGQGIDPAGPHFCFGVADLAEALAELDDRGIPYFRNTQRPFADFGEVEQVWFCDPAGNTIEIQEDPSSR